MIAYIIIGIILLVSIILTYNKFNSDEYVDGYEMILKYKGIRFYLNSYTFYNLTQQAMATIPIYIINYVNENPSEFDKTCKYILICKFEENTIVQIKFASF